jgi:hypothetical protein
MTIPHRRLSLRKLRNVPALHACDTLPAMGVLDTIASRAAAGSTVDFRLSGSSMVLLIRSRQLVTVTPVDPTTVEVGDIVLARVAATVVCTWSPQSTLRRVTNISATTAAGSTAGPVTLRSTASAQLSTEPAVPTPTEGPSVVTSARIEE